MKKPQYEVMRFDGDIASYTTASGRELCNNQCEVFLGYCLSECSIFCMSECAARPTVPIYGQD